MDNSGEKQGLSYDEIITGRRNNEELEIKREYYRRYKDIEHACSFEEFKRIYAIQKAYDNGDPIPF
jgi:hypothetical protein